MKIVTANLVPSRTAHGRADHWESRNVYSTGDGEWIDYQLLTSTLGQVHAYLFYVGPQGEGVRSFVEPGLVPGPWATIIPHVHDRPFPGDPVPDHTEHLEAGDIVMFHDQPMELVDGEGGGDMPSFKPLPYVPRETAEKVAQLLQDTFSDYAPGFGLPVLREAVHEDLRPGSWSINWEPGPQDWPQRFLEYLDFTPLPTTTRVAVTAFNGSMLYLYPSAL